MNESNVTNDPPTILIKNSLTLPVDCSLNNVLLGTDSSFKLNFSHSKTQGPIFLFY